MMSNPTLLLDPVPHVETVALGIWFGVGTRDEGTPSRNGIAHLVEHMMFKGTVTRSALDIVQQIENAGAQINAYTGRELTAYTVYALKQDLRLALDILADMLRHSVFDARELAMEQNVIVQEIGMSHDTPDDIIHDDVFETAFPDQAFGRPVLGREAVIRAMTSPDLFEYTNAHYHSGNAVISMAGNINEAEATAIVTDLFDGWTGKKTDTRVKAEYKGGVHRADKKLEQTHIVYGLPSIARGDKRLTALSLYTEALGGGMASRLFQEIREKRGLAYSVYASNQVYADTGFLNVYAGTEPGKAQECLNVLRDELHAGITHITRDDLNRAKTQRKAALLMAQESMMSRADRRARQQLMHGRIIPVTEAVAKIDAVTLDDIDALLKEITAQPVTCALRGHKVDKIAV